MIRTYALLPITKDCGLQCAWVPFRLITVCHVRLFSPCPFFSTVGTSLQTKFRLPERIPDLRSAYQLLPSSWPDASMVLPPAWPARGTEQGRGNLQYSETEKADDCLISNRIPRRAHDRHGHIGCLSFIYYGWGFRNLIHSLAIGFLACHLSSFHKMLHQADGVK